MVVSEGVYDEEVGAGKQVVMLVKKVLVDCFPAVRLFMNFKVFDLQNLPLSVDAIRGYGADEINNLAARYGNGYTNGRKLVDEWVELLPVMLRVRIDPDIVKLAEESKEAYSKGKFDGKRAASTRLVVIAR